MILIRVLCACSILDDHCIAHDNTAGSPGLMLERM